ncbi:hypothetical protein D4R51_03725 [bacterium]|nr:MAG: hypothetical protein D4R51_03725 [bacterium]
MGGTPEQPEKKIMSPEEAMEITRQRRLNLGLEADPKELSPETREALRQKIDENIGILYSYDYESFSPEVLEEWIEVGQEAEAGDDLELVAKRLESFLITLWRLKEYKNMGVASESEGKKERIFSREEILSQLGSRCEILKIERELEDEKGIYLLEVINKENTKRFIYQRERLLPGQPRGIESSGTTIRSEDLDDGFSKTIADYNPELDKWIDQ